MKQTQVLVFAFVSNFLQLIPSWTSKVKTRFYIDILVILLASNNASSNEWVILSRNNTVSENVQCSKETIHSDILNCLGNSRMQWLSFSL